MELPDEILMLISHFSRNICCYSDKDFIKDIKRIGNESKHGVIHALKYLKNIKRYDEEYNNPVGYPGKWYWGDTYHLNVGTEYYGDNL